MSLYSTLNPFPNKPWFLHVCRTSLLKTLCKKEKFLVTSNFSFSHSVFYPFGKVSTIFIKSEIVVCKLFKFGKLKNLSFGKGLTKTLCYLPDHLTLSQTSPTFYVSALQDC